MWQLKWQYIPEMIYDFVALEKYLEKDYSEIDMNGLKGVETIFTELDIEKETGHFTYGFSSNAHEFTPILMVSSFKENGMYKGCGAVGSNKGYSQHRKLGQLLGVACDPVRREEFEE